VNSNSTVQTTATKRQMLCPCCGTQIVLGIEQCACGARFVGKPLEDSSVKVRAFGPAVLPLASLALVVVGTAVFTKFLAVLVVVPAWLALRAMRLEKNDPAGYGGRRLAVATLTLAIVGGVGMAAYAGLSIPHFLENRQIRREAATEATIHHVAGILEDYRVEHHSYPKDMAELRKVLASDLPADFWEKSIRYHSYPEVLADSRATNEPGQKGTPAVSVQYDTFELRSAGPDGIEGTDDDIIMRNGIFFTNAELKKLPIARTSTDH
jgi:hypothetical protein